MTCISLKMAFAAAFPSLHSKFYICSGAQTLRSRQRLPSPASQLSRCRYPPVQRVTAAVADFSIGVPDDISYNDVLEIPNLHEELLPT